jgi:hypothetical protein
MPDRIYTTGYYVLELDGVISGLLKDFEGGAVSAEVIEELTAPGPFVKKHIGRPNYEDLVLEFGFSMNRALYDWIESSWERKNERKNGAIVLCDADMEAQSRRVFREAVIAETTLPPCDANSKDPSYVRVRLAPEYTRTEPASGKVNVVLGAKQKAWLPSNFRLSIDGLDCSRVSSIAPLTVKQRVVPDPIGELREYVREPGRVDFSNLRITMSETHAQSWIDWHQDFLINGNCGQEKEKSGTLEYLAPNLQDVLMKVQLGNLGIFRLAYESEHPDGAHIRRVVVDLYCERMELEYGNTVGVAVSQPAAAQILNVSPRTVAPRLPRRI